MALTIHSRLQAHFTSNLNGRVSKSRDHTNHAIAPSFASSGYLSSILCWTNIPPVFNVLPLAPSLKRPYPFYLQTFYTGGTWQQELTFRFSFRSHGRSTILSATKPHSVITLRISYAAPISAGVLCKIESFGEGYTVRGYWRGNARSELQFELFRRQSEGDTLLQRDLQGAQ